MTTKVKNKTTMILRITMFLMMSSVLYNNCGDGKKTTASVSENLNVENLSSGDIAKEEDVNALKTPRPEKVCGKLGFKYILQEYLYVNCVTCHSSKTIIQPPLADENVDISYDVAIFLNKEVFLESVRKNPFCGPECDLNPEGDVYKAIKEWTENSFDFNCP